MAAPLLVQSASATGSGAGVTATLPAPATTGNLLALGIYARDSPGAVFVFPRNPWTLAGRIACSAGDNWPIEMRYRLAQAGEGAAFACTGGDVGAKIDLVVAEFSGLGAAVDSSITAGPGVGETTAVLTPTAGSNIVIFAIGAARRDAGPTPFTPAAGFTEIYENTAVLGPQDFAAYRIIATAVGAYTVGETYGGGSERAVVGAAFLASTGAAGFPDGLGGIF